MYITEDIMKMLASGKSIEDITKEFTTVINEAQKKQKEAEAKAIQKQEKMAEAELIFHSIKAFFKKWYPNSVINEALNEVKIEEVEGAVAEAVKEIEGAIKLFCAPPSIGQTKASSAGVVDPITEFLKRYGL